MLDKQQTSSNGFPFIMLEPSIPQKMTVRGCYSKHRNTIRESRHDIVNGALNDHEASGKNGWKRNRRLRIWATRRREGSGSVSDTDFANFLNTARRSVFEVANMLILFTREKYLEAAESEPLLPELAEQSRMIYSFRKTLKP
jgi:23S rRNA-intervening sequence protein